jgi:hypothetical protein
MNQTNDTGVKDPLFLKCSCTSHAVEIQRYDYSQPEDVYEDEGFYIAMWLQHFNYKLTWSERFRWILNIIRTGVPWADSVLLTNDQAKQLKQYIEQHLPKE